MVLNTLLRDTSKHAFSSCFPECGVCGAVFFGGRAVAAGTAYNYRVILVFLDQFLGGTGFREVVAEALKGLKNEL